MSRGPAVAGTFYPGDEKTLRTDLEQLTGGRRPPPAPRGLALMVPHAGYIYSGPVAAATYTSACLARRVIVLGPNHTGRGQPIALMHRGAWRTPLGEATLDDELAGGVLSHCDAARIDEIAHRREHSLEVQIPFLQHLLDGLRFLPICVGTMQLSLLLDLGRAVAEAVREAGQDVLLVLSSDMSHYLPAAVAKGEDEKALAPILALDPERLHRVVVESGITMCGVAPVVAGLEAARRLGAQEARLVAYDHSGTRSGDHDSVVGYAGVAVT
jgi:AmmeMemoRadiSam system protein B